MTNRGTIEFVLKDGVKIAPDYYEYYRITVAPHNGGATQDYILRLQGVDDDVSLKIVTIDGQEGPYIEESSQYNFMVAEKSVKPYVETNSENTNIVAINDQTLSTLSNVWENEGYMYDVDLNNEVNTIEVTVKSKLY